MISTSYLLKNKQTCHLTGLSSSALAVVQIIVSLIRFTSLYEKLLEYLYFMYFKFVRLFLNFLEFQR